MRFITAAVFVLNVAAAVDARAGMYHYYLLAWNSAFIIY